MTDKKPFHLECERTEILINKAIEEDLPVEERTRLEGHLRTCASCRESMAELQALEIILDTLPEKRVAPPPYLTQKIMSNLPSHVASGWSWKFLRPMAAAAVLLLAITTGYLGRDLLVTEKAKPLTQSVRIIFYSPEANSVALIGDFNGWGKREVTVTRSSDRGIWEFTLNLQPGVYHYNLLVDGERWAANPKSSTLVPDGFGGYDSVLVVSEKCQNDCT